MKAAALSGQKWPPPCWKDVKSSRSLSTFHHSGDTATPPQLKQSRSLFFRKNLSLRCSGDAAVYSRTPSFVNQPSSHIWRGLASSRKDEEGKVGVEEDDYCGVHSGQTGDSSTHFFEVNFQFSVLWIQKEEPNVSKNEDMNLRAQKLQSLPFVIRLCKLKVRLETQKTF